MGALTSNRKRGEDYFNLNNKSPNLPSPNFDRRFDSRVSKKQKLFSSMHTSPEKSGSLKTAASRMSQYPEPINRLPRQVHAPCRVSRFGFLATSNRESKPSTSGFRQKEVSADIAGDCLSFRYEKAKTTAVGALRYYKKDKEVIDVEAETGKDGDSEDSSVEVVEVSGDGRERRSSVSDQRPQETNVILAKFQELDKKSAELNLQPSSLSVISELTNENRKVESAGKMDLSPLKHELDVLGVPLHKKLLDSAERRNSKLSSLKFQIEFNEKRRSTLQLLRPLKKLEEAQGVPQEPFTPLTEEEEAEVSHSLSNSYRRKVLVIHENSNIEITGEVLRCLRPGIWLNDEVINVYLELLKEREKREPKKFLKCHFFNTFFYKKLIGGRTGYDFKSVRRWTTQRKLGYFLIDCDKIFVPIHKEVHWCLAVINKKEEKFQYLDSLGGIDSQVLQVLARYFVDEVKDKSGKDIDVSSWRQEYVEDLPEQENGWDCGMFMIKYADFYSRGLGLCFNQEHMPYFRQRTVKEILRLKAE